MDGYKLADSVPHVKLRQENQPLAGRVADQITEWIISGTLKQGARLSEVDIAERLGVSRMPVREAFRQLENEGLLNSAPYQGCSVRQITLEMLEETYILRKELESLAAKYAVKRITDQEIEELIAIQSELDKYVAPGKGCRMDIYKLNKSFHMKIYEASHMPRLVSYIDQLWNYIAYIRIKHVTEKEYIKHMKIEHYSYIELVKNRDGEAIAKKLRDNLNRHLNKLIEDV